MYWRTSGNWEGMHRRLLARWRWVLAVLVALYVFVVADVFLRDDGTLGDALLVGLAIELIFVVVAAAFVVLLSALGAARPKP